jgi:hypothetical protein
VVAEVEGELGAGADAELLVDAAEVVLDGLHAEDELGGCLAVRFSVRHQPGDRELGRGQAFAGLGGVAGGVDAARRQLFLDTREVGRGAELGECRLRLPQAVGG